MVNLLPKIGVEIPCSCLALNTPMTIGTSLFTLDFKGGIKIRVEVNPNEPLNSVRLRVVGHKISAELPAADGTEATTVAGRVLGGAANLYELLMRRHNRRVYRAVRAILPGGDRHERYKEGLDRFADFVRACKDVIPSSYQQLLNITLQAGQGLSGWVARNRRQEHRLAAARRRAPPPVSAARQELRAAERISRVVHRGRESPVRAAAPGRVTAGSTRGTT